MAVWSAVAAVLGAGFIAGIYFGVLQVHWYVHISSWKWNGFYLKHWWDNLSSSPLWPIYRHSAFRDIPEPALATMAVLTLLAKPKWWEKNVSNLRLIWSPVALVIMTFALGIAGTWVIVFFHLPNRYSVFTLILGFLIGRVLHVFWAPVGATYQRMILTKQVGRSHARGGKVPRWVRYPLAPPVTRERFSVLYRDPTLARVESDSNYVLIAVGVILFILITALGLLAHYYIGAGHNHVPYLYP